MFGFCILSIALITVDHMSGYLDDIRAGLTLLLTPILVAADIPAREVRQLEEIVNSRDEMHRICSTGSLHLKSWLRMRAFEFLSRSRMIQSVASGINR